MSRPTVQFTTHAEHREEPESSPFKSYSFVSISTPQGGYGMATPREMPADLARALVDVMAAGPALRDALPSDGFFDLMRAALRPDAGIAYAEIEKVADVCRAARALADGESR